MLCGDTVKSQVTGFLFHADVTYTCRYGPCLKKFCRLSLGSVLCSNYWWDFTAVLVKDTFTTRFYLGNHLYVGIICIQGDNLCDLANGLVILFFF